MAQDMHMMSSNNVDAMFDGLVNAQHQMQDSVQQVTNAFQTVSGLMGPGNAMNQFSAPRRNDGFYQAQQMAFQQPFGGGFQMPQQNPGYAQPQTYGWGYEESVQSTPYNGFFGSLAPMPQNQPNNNNAYYGFYNMAYGK